MTAANDGAEALALIGRREFIRCEPGQSPDETAIKAKAYVEGVKL